VTKPFIGLKKLPGKREYCESWGSKGHVIFSVVSEFVPFFPQFVPSFPQFFLQIWGRLGIGDLQLMPLGNLTLGKVGALKDMIY
jgi:hypothetical protein